MTNYLILSTLLLIAGCQSRSTEQATTESGQRPADGQTTSSAIPDTLCFRQVVGRDTTMLQFVMNDQQVSGYLDNKPYEKDRARGSFQGSMINDHIIADWQRSGEGTTQVYPLDFTLKGDTVSWYEGERAEQEGKWVLKKPNTGYKYVLTKVSCP